MLLAFFSLEGAWMAAGTGEGSRKLPLWRVVQGLEIDDLAMRDAASTGRWQKAATRNWEF